ncbi:hypothetical protein LUZ60_006924 [Juncus effusus]|nr:hypothetical protein LUZ60_006924 [Juncus effusus]
MARKSKKVRPSKQTPISQAETFDENVELGGVNDLDEMEELDELGERNDHVEIDEIEDVDDEVDFGRMNKDYENECIVIKSDNGAQREIKGISLMDLWTLPKTDQIIIECNEDYIPHNKASYLLSSFCRDIVKRGIFAPISFLKWNDEGFGNFKDRMIEIVKEKFLYDDTAGFVEKWIFKKMNKGWRTHKGNLKKKFEKYNTVKDALDKPPNSIVLEQWRILVADWASEKKKKQCEANKENAKKQKHHHTLGRKSCARKRKEMENANGGEPIDRLTLWEEAHKKKDGSYINEATKEKMIEAKYLKETLMQNPEVDATLVVEEVFKKVMGPERGHVRGVGVGRSPTEYFRMKSNKSTNSNERSSSNEIVFLMRSHEREIAAINENHKIEVEREIAAINENHKVEVERELAVLKEQYEKDVEKINLDNKKNDKKNKKKTR